MTFPKPCFYSFSNIWIITIDQVADQRFLAEVIEDDPAAPRALKARRAETGSATSAMKQALGLVRVQSPSPRFVWLQSGVTLDELEQEVDVTRQARVNCNRWFAKDISGRRISVGLEPGSLVNLAEFGWGHLLQTTGRIAAVGFEDHGIVVWRIKALRTILRGYEPQNDTCDAQTDWLDWWMKQHPYRRPARVTAEDLWVPSSDPECRLPHPNTKYWNRGR